MSVVEKRIASSLGEPFRCSCQHQGGSAKKSPSSQSIWTPSTIVAPRPRATWKTEDEQWRCAFVWAPGRRSWIQQPIVGSTEPPVVGLVYSNATSSKGLESTLARSCSAFSVLAHGYTIWGEIFDAFFCHTGRRWPPPKRLMESPIGRVAGCRSSAYCSYRAILSFSTVSGPSRLSIQRTGPSDLLTWPW